ncbi:MAG: nucleotidyltransferase domain-containing protein [Pseudomarimonas sp.]
MRPSVSLDQAISGEGGGLRVSMKLSNEARLLVVCARPDLNEQAANALQDLLAQPLDWSAVLAAAEANYIVPLLARHLARSGAACIPDSVQQQLRDLQRKNAMVSLQLVRLQQMLVEQIFVPRGIEHAFFKGAALAQTYYGDPAQRQYRDIDVLVAADRIAEAGQALLDLGFEVSNADWQDFKVRDLRAFCRYHGALELRSPQGAQIELHKTLDSTGCIFSPAEILRAASITKDSHYPWRTLDPADLLVYVCYHHARHRWSSLHWCADLEALSASPLIDLDLVLRKASDLALTKTLEQALRLRDDLLAVAVDGSAAAPTSLFFADCMAALDASLDPSPSELPTQLEGAKSEPDFSYEWQFSERYRRRFSRLRWTPSSNDVNAWPLPNGLHWLYFLTRPWRIAWQRLHNVVGRTH